LQGLKPVRRIKPDVQVVGEVTGATEALQCIDRTKPDLVMMDMELPTSKGVLLSRQIFQPHLMAWVKT
jgi:DNA-binding NarL/FixJ family response regulator